MLILLILALDIHALLVPSRVRPASPTTKRLRGQTDLHYWDAIPKPAKAKWGKSLDVRSCQDLGGEGGMNNGLYRCAIRGKPSFAFIKVVTSGDKSEVEAEKGYLEMFSGTNTPHLPHLYDSFIETEDEQQHTAYFAMESFSQTLKDQIEGDPKHREYDEYMYLALVSQVMGALVEMHKKTHSSP